MLSFSNILFSALWLIKEISGQKRRKRKQRNFKQKRRHVSAGGMVYRFRVKCKLQVSMEIKTKRRVNTAQGKKRNESGVFTLKANRMLSFHTTPEKFDKAKDTGDFDCFE